MTNVDLNTLPFNRGIGLQGLNKAMKATVWQSLNLPISFETQKRALGDISRTTLVFIKSMHQEY